MKTINGKCKWLKPGQLVKVLSSSHPDVLAGTIGIIWGRIDDGYGVTITGDWQIAGDDRGSTVRETRVVYFEKGHVVKV